ncbi:MAG TPA: histidine kinase [Chloroflexia bacterium]|nr:histidine kinase [Chloroflexia bacterium]
MAADRARDARYGRQMELRAQLLRPILIGTAVLAGVYLAAGVTGFLVSPVYPWDGLGVLALCAGCGALLARGRTALAAAFFVAGISQPVFYAGQGYGIASPANAGFLLGIVLAGMVVGGWFLGMWTAGYCLWMLGLAWGELTGRWTPPGAIHDPMHMARWLLFWWALFIATGALVWLFARTLERAAEVARGQTAALAGTLHNLAAEPGLDTFLGRVLAVTAAQFGARWATLWLYNADTATLRVPLAYGDGQIVTPGAGGAGLPSPVPVADVALWQEAIRTRRPVVVSDIANDPRVRLRNRLLAEGVQTLLVVPLLQGDVPVGQVSINSTERRRYRPEDLDLALALAQQVTLAIQLGRLAQRGEEAAVLEERNRMAREIHDTLAQGFTGIVVQLEAAEDTLTAEPAAAQAHLDRARALARDSLAEARRSVWALRPRALEGGDLAGALDRAAQALTAGTPTRAAVHVHGVPRPLPPDLAGHLLRIGQEALTNAVRHAAARQVAIDLTYDPAAVGLRVRDDGHGFDPAAPAPAAGGGLGLPGMRERVAGLGGTLTLTSAPGAGTEVRVQVPVGAGKESA